MRKTLAAALLALGTAGTLAPAMAADTRLIPRKLLFGNPQRTGAQLSPDGRYVSWLAPRDGVLNIWVASSDNPNAAKPVTAETKRPLRTYAWAADSKSILYQQDDGGTENWRVHAVNIATGTDRDLLPAKQGARVELSGVSRLRPDTVVLGVNERDPRYFDLYEVNVNTGDKKLLLQNPGYGNIALDNQLRPRMGSKTVPGGDTQYFRLGADGKWSEFFTIKADDFFGSGTIGFSKDGNSAYLLDSRGRDTTALVALDVNSGKTRTIAASDVSDMNRVLLHPETFEPIAYSTNRLKSDWTPLGPTLAADISYLKKQLSGQFDIISSTDDLKRSLIVQVQADKSPVYWIYDRPSKKLTRFIEVRPELKPYQLSPMYAYEVESRDGLSLPTYVTIPAGADANGDGVPDRPLPTVLFVHGGPWARDNYGYNSYHQWLANRGYAVISVNYRGSTGFGKQFVNAAVGQWSGRMHDDLIDTINWAQQKGIADPKRTAIMGGSYGGYATLVGVTFTPDRFACGVDIVGPSNLKTLMQSFPPYWRPILAGTFYKHIGDPENAADVSRMMAQSPITKVDQIRVPLLIGQGANDPRVVKAESDQIVAAMKAKNLPVTYVLYPDEGHGFARPENNLSFNAVTESFLGKCLGGRIEPVGDDFKGSSIKVLEGADQVPGLKAALAQ